MAAAASNPTERVLTRPLLGFLLLVTAVLAFGLVTRMAAPDLPGAVAELDDGDLDRGERNHMLDRVLTLTDGASDGLDPWFGLLASVARGDAERYRRHRAAVAVVGAADAEAFAELDLGDPMLANVRDAVVAELLGDEAAAVREWQQVAAEALLSGQGFAAELAAGPR